MVAVFANLKCTLYQGAFSGEVVFMVKNTSGQPYEGIAPKHYAKPTEHLSSKPTDGQLEVRVITNGGGNARVRMPDGENIEVRSVLLSDRPASH